jgi:electron transport complex protein RnfA
MIDAELWALFLNAALVNNFVLAYFLGICPFLGVSGRLESAGRMGLAVTFVMLVASLCAFALNRVLAMINAEYLALISYIVVIASAVQLVEMFVRKTSPALFQALGIFLPLITTNCAILAVALFQTQRGYGLLEGLVFAFGAGLGFTLALVLMAGIRERLRLADVPDLAQGMAVTLVLAGILSLAFMGFAGMGVAP